MFSSILNFEFHNFGFISDFLGPLWATFGGGVEFKNCFGVCSCSSITFIFPTVPLIQNFDFDLIFGSFFIFWDPHGLFFTQGRIQKLFLGLLM